MSKLREKTIQNKALAALTKYYLSSNAETKIFSEAEVRTKKEFGGKRADGLICFKKNGKIYTASLEAKSHKTLNQLISTNDDEKLGLHIVVLTIALTIVTVLSLIIFTHLRWYLITAITLAASCSFFIVSVWIIDYFDLETYRFISVINQLKQYPANEQWIAYSKYTDNLLFKTPTSRRMSHLQTLESLRQKNGFGLILISNNKVETINPLKVRNGEFVHHYCREKEIREKLT